MSQLFKQEILYGIYSKTYFYIILFLVSLFVLVSYTNYSVAMSAYNSFLHTENFYKENNLDIEKDLEGEYELNYDGNQDVVENPILYEKEMVSTYVYTASPKYALTQFLESAFLYFPIVFGTIGLLIAIFDFKYKTIKLKTVRESKFGFGIVKQASLMVSGLFILSIALIIAFLINYFFYYKISEAIPISEFQSSLSNAEPNSTLLLRFFFAYVISVIFMTIGYTLGIMFKNIYIGFILIAIYMFFLPSFVVFDLKNSLHYLGNRIYDFYGVLSIESGKDGTTLITSVCVVLFTLIVSFVINIIITEKRSSFES
ncbi:hypothetical protein [Bacillus chungangensis]|uniref:ABC transporter permease n=1 Tax=Bacillus chungangensis TaxID=587633 RepID=A0ABT9WRP2_9BACI|nr:hypothetical protein [Bacillus chungangensis]MDQ0175963.1 hypothetical protein [Bacillus chungangensis]